ncbi:MAG: EAL domain-containing protein [Legionellaceae bacterium]|nr:EAL domain-containing protein [Legionellaceae bacterium]
MKEYTNLFKSIFITSVQPSIVIDTLGIVKEYNPAAESLFQYARSEMLGKNIKKLMPSETAKKHDDYLDTYKRTKTPHIIGTGREVVAQKKDGTLVDIFLSISEIRLTGEVFYAAVINDITQERMLREQNQKLIDFNLAMIHDVEALGDYDDLIQNILKHFSTLFNFEVGHFYQYNHVKQHLESSGLFFKNRPRKYHAFIEVTKQTLFKKGVGLPGTAWEKQSPIYYPDIRIAQNFPRNQMSQKSFGLMGALALPVKYNNKLLGVVEFFSDKVLYLSEEDVSLIEKFSNIINGLYGQYRESRVLNLLLDSCSEGVYGLDMEGVTTFVNARACEILGYTAEELIGCSMHEKVHHTHPDGSFYPKEDCHIAHCIRENKRLHINDEVFWSKNDQPIFVEYNVTSIIENKNIVGGVVTFLDISEKRKVKQQMEIISNIQSNYIKAEKETVIFEDILQHMINLTQSEYGFIGSVKSDDKGLPYLETHAISDCSWHKAHGDHYEQLTPNLVEFRNLNTLFGRTIKTKKMFISNQPSKDKERRGLPRGPSEVTSYLGIPLVGLSGELIGMYGLANRKEGYSQQLVHDLTSLTGVVSNIIESYQYYTVIEEMAKIDSLTRLFNRQFAHLRLSEMIEKHRCNKTCFCLLMLDLNQFKFVNDKYGANIGDQLLISFSKRISSLLKSSDFFARVGGDEFLILLENTSSSNQFTELVTCLNIENDRPYQLDGKTISCGLTMGVACYPSGGKTKEELLSHVAFALYDAKRKKESICFFSKKSKQFFEQINQLESDFKQAFIKKEFCMLYQPQVDLMTGEILGLEALIRWNHPTRGLLSPFYFIAYLEDWGLSEKLNEYVLKIVLADIKILNLDKYLKISINISPKIMNFKSHIASLVAIARSKQAMLNTNKINLEFEITESSFSSQKASDLNIALRQAKGQGIKCAMDDFGMEYSSINRLTQYQFDTVKIDKVFTQKLDKRGKKSATAIINALIQLSEDLKFKLIAEGPETKAQVDALLDLGCCYGQGFYFHKPMPITKARQLIKKQGST